jgi:hypothetical protein
MVNLDGAYDRNFRLNKKALQTQGTEVLTLGSVGVHAVGTKCAIVTRLEHS